MATADYGAYPADYSDIVHRFADPLLRDPYSAHWRLVGGPGKFASADLGTTTFGYGVCYAVNAKNDFGNYTGEQLHFFLIRNGDVVKALSDSRDATKYCQTVVQSTVIR